MNKAEQFEEMDTPGVGTPVSPTWASRSSSARTRSARSASRASTRPGASANPTRGCSRPSHPMSAPRSGMPSSIARRSAEHARWPRSPRWDERSRRHLTSRVSSGASPSERSTLLEADTSAVFLAEPDGQTFRAIAAVGDNADGDRGRPRSSLAKDHRRLPRPSEGQRSSTTSSATRGAFRSRAGREPRRGAADGRAALGRRRLSGMMAVWRERDGPVFTQADLDFLVGLSQQATIAIDNARLFAEAHVAARRRRTRRTRPRAPSSPR